MLHRGPLNALDSFLTTGSDGSSQQGSKGRNGPPMMKAFQCFLFEQIMIFSEMVGKKTTFTSPSYEYKAHFLVSNAYQNFDICIYRYIYINLPDWQKSQTLMFLLSFEILGQ